MPPRSPLAGSIEVEVVQNGLRPVREGVKDKGKLTFPALSETEQATLELAGVPTPEESMTAFREGNTLPLCLYVEVEGDPALAEQI